MLRVRQPTLVPPLKIVHGRLASDGDRVRRPSRIGARRDQSADRVTQHRLDRTGQPGPVRPFLHLMTPCRRDLTAPPGRSAHSTASRPGKYSNGANDEGKE